jgi:uncharacterized protein
MLRKMRVAHCIRACVAAVGVALAAASAEAQTASTTSNFLIRVRGVAIGSEQVTIARAADGTIISSTGRFGAPIDIVLRTLQIRYGADGAPLSMSVDASLRDQGTTVTTTISGATATNSLTPPDGQTVTNSQPIDRTAILLPNPFVAPYEAVAMRLRDAAPDSTMVVFQPTAPPLSLRVGNSTPQQIQTLDGLIRARQTAVTLSSANGASVAMDIWADHAGRLLRVNIPGQQIEYIREDIASVSTRLVTMSRPNDEDVFIPANGFSLAGTLSKPAAPGAARLPAILLLSGANRTDRDETIGGVPIFGQLADAFADSGAIVLRYDKRGVGQSGGRADVATLNDYADDAKAAIEFLRDRKDVDRRRIAVVGHGEGGWLAMLTAAGNGRVAAVGLLSTAAVSGADWNLYRVGHQMERSGRSPAERQQALALQQQLQQAVLSGRGWEAPGITPQMRQQADTPYFQSFLAFDPATLIRRVDQPILIVQGALDKQVPADSAQRLESMARERKNKIVSVVQVPAVNHLLVPATTGEIAEYATLADHKLHPAVLSAVTAWARQVLK